MTSRALVAPAVERVLRSARICPPPLVRADP